MQNLVCFKQCTNFPANDGFLRVYPNILESLTPVSVKWVLQYLLTTYVPGNYRGVSGTPLSI